MQDWWFWCYMAVFYRSLCCRLHQFYFIISKSIDKDVSHILPISHYIATLRFSCHSYWNPKLVLNTWQKIEVAICTLHDPLLENTIPELSNLRRGVATMWHVYLELSLPVRPLDGLPIHHYWWPNYTNVPKPKEVKKKWHWQCFQLESRLSLCRTSPYSLPHLSLQFAAPLLTVCRTSPYSLPHLSLQFAFLLHAMTLLLAVMIKFWQIMINEIITKFSRTGMTSSACCLHFS